MKVTEIHELVKRASVVTAHYWPMTSFVHHNPIRSLETLPFDEAIQVARRFIGGRGYLANKNYRDLVKSGRIEARHLDAAVESHTQNKELKLNEKTIKHFEVVRAHLLEGITAPAAETILALVDRMPGAASIKSLAKRLKLKPEDSGQHNTIARDISLSTWCDQEMKTELVWQVDRELIKWCEAFIDEGHAAWAMPEKSQGFYAAWKVLAAKEWSPCGIAGSSRKIQALPGSAAEAVLEHLDALAIPEELRQDYLSLQLTALNGWASFINWRSEHSDYQWQKAFPIDLVQYLAVRLFYERELVNQACQAELGIEAKFDSIVTYHQAKESTTRHPAKPRFASDVDKKKVGTVQRTSSVSKDKGNFRRNSTDHAEIAAAWRLTKLIKALGIPEDSLASAPLDQLMQLLDWLDDFPESEHGAIWLQAYEAGYQEDLIDKLQAAASGIEAHNSEQKPRALAQMMFCIDVRSEPFRRSLETVGNYATIGFAGFFGIPIQARALDQHHVTDQFPAIVQAQYTVHERAREGQSACKIKHDSRKNFLGMLHEIFHDLKANVLTPYILVETFGWLFIVQMLEKTIFPGTYRKWRKRIRARLIPKVATEISRDKDEHGLGLSQDQQNTHIETALRMMGLTDNFARLVVVAGHTSMSDNNPYEAALNCGACGGNSGEPNARLFASIANKPQVREHLAKNGIVVPVDTHFLAAVHNTTTDGVDLFDLEDLPSSHREDIEQLKLDLKKAAIQTNQERCRKLPGAGQDLSPSSAVAEINRRSADWCETRPEWGLSGNASFIIGRRELTREINLEGRAFLNSHDYRLDPTGALLEGILMGPMVVGQWINSEHYFSATDPEIYGSGSKIYHNVVGRIGIMSGPQSDLRTGLALQSVASGDITYHEPLRLFVAVEAPRERISEIIERQSVLKQLCKNEWIHLMAIDNDSDKKLYLYQVEQGWTAVTNPQTRSTAA